MVKVSIIPVTQPIGTFYIGSMNADLLYSITNLTPRRYDEQKGEYTGIQRKLSSDRLKDIAEYCSSPDATFPTPIIISVYDNVEYKLTPNELEFNDNVKLGDIIDGQHRLVGIMQSDYRKDFYLPVIFMFYMSEEDKAYVFSIINGKQTKVSMSLIYDLFDLSQNRSPQKTCHEIAKLFNNKVESPFFNRLKMLGYKQNDEESLSQGTFVKYLLSNISKYPDKDERDLKKNVPLIEDPNLPLRYYFVKRNDEIIYKILFNLFSAIKEVFPEEWNNPDKYILTKTTGYGAIIKSFNRLYELGDNKNDLTQNFFISCFEKVKIKLKSDGLELTSVYFPSSAHTQEKLSKYIIDSVEEKKSSVSEIKPYSKEIID